MHGWKLAVGIEVEAMCKNRCVMLDRSDLPEDVSAAVVDGLGHEAHQAAAAAAVDKIELPLHLHK